MVVIVMGVSGSGKSTIGSLLAERLGVPFFDADDFHSLAAVAKMKAGTPLNDEDRAPWLERLNREVVKPHASGKGAVLACSALKSRYRAMLESGATSAVRFVHLQGSAEVIRARMAARQHFMPASLLESQFASLEAPANAIIADISKTPSELMAEIALRLK